MLVEVDLAGARAFGAAMPQALARLHGAPELGRARREIDRPGTVSAEVVERRLATARVELEAQDEFDEVIVNEDVSRSCDELVSLSVGRPEQSESTRRDLTSTSQTISGDTE